MFIYTLFRNPIYFFSYIAIIIISITLHELAHGLAALNQGDDTPKIAGHWTLNPVVHMGRQSIIFLCLAGIAWGQMPVNPEKFRSPKLGNILVSAAGPLSNLALGLLSIVWLKLTVTHVIPVILSLNLIYMIIHINLVLFLFNILPIPPLDGYQIFSEIFPHLKKMQNSMVGLFALVVFFMSPIARGISAVADSVIKAIAM